MEKAIKYLLSSAEALEQAAAEHAKWAVFNVEHKSFKAAEMLEELAMEQRSRALEYRRAANCLEQYIRG